MSGRLKRITRSHIFGTFLLFSHSRPSVVLAASARVVRSKVDHIGLFHVTQSQLMLLLMSFSLPGMLFTCKTLSMSLIEDCVPKKPSPLKI